MKKTLIFGFAGILLITTVAWPQNKAVVETPKAETVIQAPKESRLTWENHRLKAANFRLQAEVEDKAADAELEAMQRAIGDKYAPRISQQTGQLEFYLKEVRAVDTKIQLPDTKMKSPEKTTEKPKQ